MSAANVLTLTCPHCARQLRVGVEHAGWRTRCPHPDCRRSLTIPHNLDHDNEPEEAVLIAEGPPVPIPVTPRYGPRADDRFRPPRRARGPARLWALAALLVGAAVALVVGWAIVKAWRARADRTAGTPAADFRPADTKGSAEHAPPPREPEPIAPVQPIPEVPRPEPVAAPGRKNPPRGRDAFVGRWAAVEVPQQGAIEVTIEFRADGGCELAIDGPGTPAQRFAGAWKWEDDRLSLSLAGVDGARPSEVKWNGPDEFIAINDDKPATFRRRK